eukprot:994154_1
MLNFNQMDPLRRNSHLVGGFLYNASHSQTHGNNRYPDYVASEPSSNNHEYQHDLAVSNQGISPPIQQRANSNEFMASGVSASPNILGEGIIMTPQQMLSYLQSQADRNDGASEPYEYVSAQSDAIPWSVYSANHQEQSYHTAMSNEVQTSVAPIASEQYSSPQSRGADHWGTFPRTVISRTRSATRGNMMSSETTQHQYDLNTQFGTTLIDTTLIETTLKVKYFNRIMFSSIGFNKIGIKWHIKDQKCHFIFVPKEKCIQHQTKQPDILFCASLTSIAAQMKAVLAAIDYLPKTLHYQTIFNLIKERSNNNVNILNGIDFINTFVNDYNEMIITSDFEDCPKRDGCMPAHATDAVEEEVVGDMNVDAGDDMLSAVDSHYIETRSYSNMLRQKDREIRRLKDELQDKCIAYNNLLSKTKALLKENKKLKKPLRTWSEIENALQQYLLNRKKSKITELLYSLISDNIEVKSRVISEDEKRAVSRVNRQIIQEKYCFQNMIKYALKSIEHNFSHRSQQGIREMICLEPKLKIQNGIFSCGTESFGKKHKKYNGSSSNNKNGWATRLMRNINCFNVGALQYKLKSWHKSEATMKRERNALFVGEFDVSMFHPQSQQILLNYRAHKPRLLTCVNEGEKYAEIQAKFENERYIIVNINEKECGNDSGMNEAKRGTKRKATTRRSNHNKSRRGNKNSIRIFTTV